MILFAQAAKKRSFVKGWGYQIKKPSFRSLHEMSINQASQDDRSIPVKSRLRQYGVLRRKKRCADSCLDVTRMIRRLRR